MRVRVERQNITQDELTKALVGYIDQEGIASDVLARLQKKESHDQKDEIPELYLRTIIQRFEREFKSLMLVLSANIDAWFAQSAKMPRRAFLRKDKGKDKPPILSNVQMDELRLLIESHFKYAIGIGWDVSNTTQKRWDKMGIEHPDEQFNPFIDEAYIAGRVSHLLDHTDSYEEMLRIAKKVPFSRTDDLVAQAAKANAAKYIVGYVRKLADLAEDMLIENHKRALNDVVSRYFSGDLTHTTYNKDGFTPQEAESLLATDKAVKGWRELATELKSRFRAVDVGRDWDRIAVTETRYASNLGRLQTIQEEGGGDPDEVEVYYHVQKTACKHCKKLYLEPDGTPKRFKLSSILRNMQKTGGMNIGRKASLPEDDGGYLPNVVTHPNCACYMIRYMEGYPMIAPNQKEAENHD